MTEDVLFLGQRWCEMHEGADDDDVVGRCVGTCVCVCSGLAVSCVRVGVGWGALLFFFPAVLCVRDLWSLIWFYVRSLVRFSLFGSPHR